MGPPLPGPRYGRWAEAVHDGANGRLFSAEATPVDYADAVEELLRDREAYRALAERSRLEHETRLNWPATVRAMREELMALRWSLPAAASFLCPMRLPIKNARAW